METDTEEDNSLSKIYRQFVQEHVQECQKKKARGETTTPLELSIPKGIDFSYMNWFQGNFDGCSFNGCSLNNVIATHCSFKGASFVEADMSSMRGNNGNFQDANLEKADMRFGDFRNADFAGASMEEVRKEHAKFNNLTWKEVYGR